MTIWNVRTVPNKALQCDARAFGAVAPERRRYTR